MKYNAQNLPTEVIVQVPEEARVMFAHLCSVKDLTAEQAATIGLIFMVRMAQQHPLHQEMDLLTELRFSAGLCREVNKKLTGVLSLAEKVLIESEALKRTMMHQAITGV